MSLLRMRAMMKTAGDRLAADFKNLKVGCEFFFTARERVVTANLPPYSPQMSFCNNSKGIVAQEP